MLIRTILLQLAPNNMVDWTRIVVHLLADFAILCLCLLARFFAHWAGWEWPWERRAREMLGREVRRHAEEVVGKVPDSTPSVEQGGPRRRNPS
jgi:hypothetical protein